MKIARVYLRVSTNAQDLNRQLAIVEMAKSNGYYIAGVYREKASGADADRPELLRMIADLQPGEVVIAERMDRISRLPLPEAEKLVASIREKGARLSVPDVVDLSSIGDGASGVARIVFDAVQDMLLKLALHMARDDYELRRERQRQGIQAAKQAGKYRGRQADQGKNQKIIELRRAGHSIAKTADFIGCSLAQVKRIWREYQLQNKDKPANNGQV